MGRGKRREPLPDNVFKMAPDFRGRLVLVIAFVNTEQDVGTFTATVECVTCYVKCVSASSDTAMYAGMSCELNHVLEGCYEKFGTCALE